MGSHVHLIKKSVMPFDCRVIKIEIRLPEILVIVNKDTNIILSAIFIWYLIYVSLFKITSSQSKINKIIIVLIELSARMSARQVVCLLHVIELGFRQIRKTLNSFHASV